LFFRYGRYLLVIFTVDNDLLHSTTIDAANINRNAKDLSSVVLKGDAEVQWLLRSVGSVDLTTLAGDDTSANVARLCAKAKRPLSTPILDKLSEKYAIKPEEVIATGFPSGQYSLKSRLEEIDFAISSGATEIDIVINRTLALEGRWKELFDEVSCMRKVCGEKAHLKTILAVGELGSYSNVYASSMACMLAGADFIKTSTGKESTVNATLPVTAVMCRAINDFYDIYGVKVGYKPAGGLKTWKDAISFISLVNSYLGQDWLSREYFRIGASSLLGSVEARLFTVLHGGRSPLSGELAFM
uniref:deoxyribose-phosphate aldolase n=1 Tax=Schistocephalus solidus TaxID=70667 RepID=A0A183SY50_SCHSO